MTAPVKMRTELSAGGSALEWMTSCSLSDDPELSPFLLVIGRVGESVAIDGGVIVRRDWPRREIARARKRPAASAKEVFSISTTGPMRDLRIAGFRMRNPVLIQNEAVVDQLGGHGFLSPK